jgi:outer membrane protein OmpA-like peptidoglycan-associated protein
MDRQEAALRAELRKTGVSVTRDGDNLVLNMQNDILFDTNSARVKPQAAAAIHSVALVLKRFRSTLVNVDGFTDTAGARDYNLRLSAQRADAVADRLVSNGVDAVRLSTRGYGENYLKVRTRDGADEPRNRRVEITLEPFTG